MQDPALGGIEDTERIRDLAMRLSLAEQRERDRIARLLHDDLQQSLHCIQMLLHVVCREKEIDPSVLNTLDKELDEAISLTRDLAVTLSPPVLRQASFIDSLRWLQSRFEASKGFSFTLHADDRLPEPSANMRIVLFQIIQELLLNVVKHARVRDAVVRISSDPSALLVKVEDTGCGFDPAQLDNRTTPHSGFGLVGLAERVVLFGGTLTITSQPGSGCSVSLRVPEVEG